jgi:NADH-dependent peroxiredoxin subunit C
MWFSLLIGVGSGDEPSGSYADDIFCLVVAAVNCRAVRLVVFFYPADFTFVCPTELGDLADNYAALQKMGVEIYGVSTDTHCTHKAWHDTSETFGRIKFPMIGDPTGVIARNASELLRKVKAA